MANAGIKSSQAGTAMRTMLTSLTGDVTFVGDSFGELTVQTVKTDSSMRSLGDIMTDCRAAFSQMTDSEKAANAEALVGKNVMSGFLDVMNAAPGDIQKLNEAISNCDGTAEKRAATMQDNLAGQLTILKSQLEELAISVGEILMPSIRQIVGWIQGLVDWLSGLDDSTIFLSAITPIPDITEEMLEWWMIWHQLDPLRYVLWNPEDHFDVKLSDKDRGRFLDNSIPIRERIWGTSSVVTESWNGEDYPTEGELHFVSPDSVGLKNELVGTPKCKAIVVANNCIKIGPINYPVMMCEYVRENLEGKNEWVVTAWMGHGVKDGKDIQMKLPKPLLKKMASKMPAMFIVHNHKEVGHLNKILPRLYADQKNNWLE